MYSFVLERVQSGHPAISLDAKKHLTVNKTVELLRKEQSMMELNFLKAVNGEINTRESETRHSKAANIKRIIDNYKSTSIEENLLGLANNMGDKNSPIEINNFLRDIIYALVIILLTNDNDKDLCIYSF